MLWQHKMFSLVAQMWPVAATWKEQQIISKARVHVSLRVTWSAVWRIENTAGSELPLWATRLGSVQHRLDLALAEQTGCKALPGYCTPQVLSQEREKCCVCSLLWQRQNHPWPGFQHVCGCTRITKDIASGKCLIVKTKGWAAVGCAGCCILLLTFTWKDTKPWGKLLPLKSNERKGWYFSWGFEVRSLHQRDYSFY